jgi:GYF domain 2
MNNIFVHKDGQQYGPFTIEQIHHELKIGNLSRLDYAWHEGLSDWQPIGTLLRKRHIIPRLVISAAVLVLSISVILFIKARISHTPFAGTHQAIAQSTPPSTPEPTSPSPVDELKRLISQYDGRRVIRLSLTDVENYARIRNERPYLHWTEINYRFPVFSYDVKKTDSLVIPYVAYVTLALLNSENAYPEDNKWVGKIIEQQYNKEWVTGVFEHPMLCQIRNNFPITWEKW